MRTGISLRHFKNIRVSPGVTRGSHFWIVSACDPVFRNVKQISKKLNSEK